VSDEKTLDSMIDKGEPITHDDVVKRVSADKGLRSVNEGYIYKFAEQISKKQDTQDKSKD